MTDEVAKLSICLRLREASETLGRLFENVACDSAPLVCLEEVNRLQDLACELQTAFMRIAKQPGEMAFVGTNVLIPGERTPVEDKASQRVVGLEKLEADVAWTEQSRWDSERLEAARKEAGVTSLLDDTASLTNHDRDQRSSAAE